MEIRDFEELTRPDAATIAFGSLDVADRNEQARSVQSMVADTDLWLDIPEDFRDSFDRLRRLFAYGLFLL